MHAYEQTNEFIMYTSVRKNVETKSVPLELHWALIEYKHDVKNNYRLWEREQIDSSIKIISPLY